MIVGIDEVGRGCLAGPVFAVAIVLKKGCSLPEGIKDSKKLSPKKREIYTLELAEVCFLGIGLAQPKEIDKLNIHQATFLAMQRALEDLQQKFGSLSACQILVDGRAAPPFSYPITPIIGGDRSVPIISAASIVAKVARDHFMEQLHDDFPAYDFFRNKGYGTPHHLRVLRELGPCIHHRQSFSPCILNAIVRQIKHMMGEGVYE